MTKISRARYTLEFKQEAVRLVENSQSTAAVARTLGVVDQTLFNWVKASHYTQVRNIGSSMTKGADGWAGRNRNSRRLIWVTRV